MTAIEDQLALFEFEGHRPDGSRHSISGSFSTEDDDGNPLPDLPLDQLVTLRVVARVKAVNHKRDKEGALERQHVLVIEGAQIVGLAEGAQT